MWTPPLALRPPGMVLREFPSSSLGKVKLILGNKKELTPGPSLRMLPSSTLLFTEDTVDASEANFRAFMGRIFQKYTQGYLSQALL